MAASMNADASELARFARLAQDWWDPKGPFRALHEINPLRLSYLREAVPLAGRRVLDVGCGGGLLAEAMAREGARVLGIDLEAGALQAALEHAADHGLALEYREIAVEALAAEQPASFELVTCMEMLEHVPEPEAIVAACAELVQPGGTVVFSTFHRTPQAFLAGIVAAEYLLHLVPRGTHEYHKFLRPSELAAACRAAGLTVVDLTGLRYRPFAQRHTLTPRVEVNYLLRAERPA